MPCTLYREDVASTLRREHDAARALREAYRTQPQAGQDAPVGERDFRTSDAHKTQYLSVGPQMGRFLYTAARMVEAKNIIEFGTSFGISTTYLAAAAADTGGRVTGSEFHALKAAKAQENLADAGLSHLAEIRVGDARETLRDVAGPIDLLFLDGANDLYLEILTMLEDRLRPGALVVADNADRLPRDEGFLAYVDDRAGRYFTSMTAFGKGLASQSLVIA